MPRAEEDALKITAIRQERWPYAVTELVLDCSMLPRRLIESSRLRIHCESIGFNQQAEISGHRDSGSGEVAISKERIERLNNAVDESDDVFCSIEAPPTNQISSAGIPVDHPHAKEHHPLHSLIADIASSVVNEPPAFDPADSEEPAEVTADADESAEADADEAQEGRRNRRGERDHLPPQR